MPTLHLWNTLDKELPHLAGEHIEVIDEVKYDIAHNVIIRNSLDRTANTLDNGENTVDYVHIARIAHNKQLLHHCWPLNVVILQSNLD